MAAPHAAGLAAIFLAGAPLRSCLRPLPAHTCSQALVFGNTVNDVRLQLLVCVSQRQSVCLHTLTRAHWTRHRCIT